MSSKQQKRAVEKSAAKQKELESALSVVRAQLIKTENKLAKAKDRSERWKTEAKAQRRSAAQARARAEKLRRKLDKASAALRPAVVSLPPRSSATDGPAAEPTVTAGVAVPDSTWSVVQLRAEARARGLVGMSNKPKAQLLAALT